jgi:hypothetical protein
MTVKSELGKKILSETIELSIHESLKKKMKEVDDLAFEQKERLKLSAPADVTLPVVSEDILQLREARR